MCEYVISQVRNTVLSAAEQSLKCMTHLGASISCSLELVIMTHHYKQHLDKAEVTTELLEALPSSVHSYRSWTQAGSTFQSLVIPQPSILIADSLTPSPSSHHQHHHKYYQAIQDLVQPVAPPAPVAATLLLSQCLDRCRLALSCESQALELCERVLKELGNLSHDFKTKLNRCSAEVEEHSSNLRARCSRYEEEVSWW
jgi:hypothetical protein